MPDQPAVTLEHVALAAGVSRATASRVLTGSGPSSAHARRRVEEAASRLGYVADPVARALVGGRGTRLVVAVSGGTDDVLACDHLARVVSSAARVCGPEGLGVAVRWLPLTGPERTLEALGRDRSVAGVVLVNTTDRVLASVPSGLHGRIASIGVGSQAVPLVDVDSGPAAAAITAHLVSTGRRRIAMLAGPPWLPCTRRPLLAHRAVLRAAGLPERVVAGDFTPASGRAGALEVLRRWPDTDAVYAICDEVALGAMQVLRRLGRLVPGDVAVSGFDDLPAAEFSGPGLTTATHPVEQIAAAAARVALTREGAGPQLFRSELVLRESA
jgi:DNA-binding LacI/PurR family transcriptional regulator